MDSDRENQTSIPSFEGTKPLTGLLLLSPDLRVIYISESLLSLLKIDADTAVNLRCADLFHPDREGCLHCPIFSSLKTGLPASWSLRTGTENGSLDLEFNALPELDGEGKALRLISAVSDISRIRETERRLREIDHLYRAVVEDQPAIVYRYKIDGTIVFGNRMLAKYTNRSMDELIGMNMFDIIEPKNREKARWQLSRLSPENQVATHEHAGTGADGKKAWYQWTDRLILDEDGNPKEYQGVGYDITNRKRIEETERRQRELAEALLRTGEALNSSLDLNEVLSRVLSNLHRMVPHDAAILMMIDEENRISRMLMGEDYASHGVNLDAMDGMSAYELPILGRLLRGEDWIILDDVKESGEWRDLPGFEWIRSMLCMPIISGNACIGFINLYAVNPSRFSTEDAEPLRLFANQAALAIRNARHYENAAWLATHDSLTGLLTRRSFFEHAAKEFHRAVRSIGPLSVIMMDLDHFKDINDTYGHAAGDAVLEHVATVIRAETRENDEVGRYGGEEFIVLLPDTDVAEAERCAERMRCALLENPPPWEGEPLYLTGSFGVAGSVPALEGTRSSDPLDVLIERADAALYVSKRKGRNRVSRWGEEFGGQS